LAPLFSWLAGHVMYMCQVKQPVIPGLTKPAPYLIRGNPEKRTESLDTGVRRYDETKVLARCPHPIGSGTGVTKKSMSLPLPNTPAKSSMDVYCLAFFMEFCLVT